MYSENVADAKTVNAVYLCMYILIGYIPTCRLISTVYIGIGYIPQV